MIDDTTARRIASEWHGGQNSALYMLTSSGAIPDLHETTGEINQCITYELAHPQDDPPGMLLINIRDLQSLVDYVMHHGPRGPVQGWGELTW